MGVREDFVRLCGGDNHVDTFDLFVTYANKCNIDYEYQMQQALASSMHLPSEDQFKSMLDVIDSILDACVQRIGVRVYDTATTKELVSLAIGINQLLDYEDKKTLLEMISTEESNTDKLANLLECSGVVTSDKWLSIISYVAQYTIDALKAHLSVVVDITAEDLQAIKAKVNTYYQFKEVVKTDIPSDVLLSNTSSINRDINEYIPMLKGKLAFYENNPDMLVLDFYGFCLLSKQGITQFQQSTIELAKNFYLSPAAQKTVALEISALVHKLATSDKRIFVNTKPLESTGV